VIEYFLENSPTVYQRPAC